MVEGSTSDSEHSPVLRKKEKHIDKLWSSEVKSMLKEACRGADRGDGGLLAVWVHRELTQLDPLTFLFNMKALSICNEIMDEARAECLARLKERIQQKGVQARLAAQVCN